MVLEKKFFSPFFHKAGEGGANFFFAANSDFRRKNAPFLLFFSFNFSLSINHREERKPDRGGDLKAYSQTGEEAGPILFIF